MDDDMTIIGRPKTLTVPGRDVWTKIASVLVWKKNSSTITGRQQPVACPGRDVQYSMDDNSFSPGLEEEDMDDNNHLPEKGRYGR